MKRNVTNYIIIHCSDTYADMDIGASEIRKWHVEERKWKDIGYHIVIRRDGVREIGRDIDEVGAHVKGYNRESIGICLVGGKGKDGKPEDNFTKHQKNALIEILQTLKIFYKDAEVLGHRDLNAGKDCPCFDAKRFYVENI